MLMCILVCGCRPDENPVGIDQCMRNRIFNECLANIPKGPQSAVEENDWADVIAECRDAAFYQSKRIVKYIKEECRL